MEEIFNPYREWLGWEQSRAPDYYELLAIDRGESDTSRIARAAEQAASKVRSFRPGPRAAIWSRLLDEIRAAKDCLSNPALREQYDAALARSDVLNSAAGGLHVSANGALLPPAEWAAGPSPVYDAELGAVTTPICAMPATSDAASAVPYSGSAHELPMAIPVQRGGPRDAARYDGEPAEDVQALLPPGSDGQASDGPAYAGSVAAQDVPTAFSTAPTAASVSAARERKSRSTLLIAAASCIALVAISGALLIAQRPRPVVESQRVTESDQPSVPAAIDKSGPSLPDRSIRTAAERATTSAEIDQSPTAIAIANDPAGKPNASSAGNAVSAVTTTIAITPALSPEERRSRTESLVTALQTARSALGEQNFSLADQQILRAESLADMPNHRQAVARLKEVAGYVRQFRTALAAAVHTLQAAETFKTNGGNDVAFVEATGDRVVFHVSGTNRTYALSDLPPGLALAIADRKLSTRDSASLVIKGAYLAVHPRADDQTRDKAASLWQQAAAAGADVSHLTRFLTEDYAAFLTGDAR